MATYRAQYIRILFNRNRLQNIGRGTSVISRLNANQISISMDGRGRAFDNIFIERLWRTVKYQNVYINGYETMQEAQNGLRAYFNRYNHERRHQSLDYEHPWDVYTGTVRLAA